MTETSRLEGAVGIELGRQTCLTCFQLIDGLEPGYCPRCGERVAARIPEAISRTWAWVITGTLLLYPANKLPVMSVTRLGQTETDSIMGGVFTLYQSGQLAIAILVFVASVVVPGIKLLGLTYLCLTVQYGRNFNPLRVTRLYRLVHLIGRWSLLDLFLISILVALVNLGSIARIEAQSGATAFATVVIVTMFASHSFDPRLIWDRHRKVQADG
ncbi:paraquat-inducible protein A [Biformimicrobium ophioploci]|uniref:Paraquat-inducible protein A n=1 Tax=Biformimicrobium ophioploci TaxID=3036711 RepID=A0ABQ6M0R1_9GAMM|nr:paraquat-inducible protein A [Microbulbifer sp. NKW57]GMG87889.1 paraquat-inducible protein A [Microbulbifer sp. NKW57]